MVTSTFLLDKGSISQEDHEKAFLKATSANDPEALTGLLEMGRISTAICQEACKKCVRNGYVECLRIVLKDGLILMEDRIKAMKEAIEYNDAIKAQLIYELLQNGAIPLPFRFKTLLESIKYRSFDLVAVLLEKAPFSNKRRERGILEAAKYGDLYRLESFLTKDVLTNEQAAEIREKAKHSHQLAALLKESFITKEVRSNAVEMAAKNGYDAIVIRLLQDGPISNESRMRAIASAMQGKHIGCLKMLLANCHVEFFIKAFVDTVSLGSLELLPQIAIVEPILGNLLSEAASKNYHFVCRAMLQNRVVSDESRMRAMISAIRASHADTLKILLKDIRDPLIVNVLFGAVQEGNLEMFNLILTQITLTEAQRGSVLCEAACKDKLSIARALLKNGPISQRDLGAALKKAAEIGSLPIVEDIYKSGPILEEHLKQAMEIVKIHNHEDIAMWLKTQQQTCVIS